MAAGSSLASRLIGTRITTGGAQTMSSLTHIYSLGVFFPCSLHSICCSHHGGLPQRQAGRRQRNAKERSHFPEESTSWGEGPTPLAGPAVNELGTRWCLSFGNGFWNCLSFFERGWSIGPNPVMRFQGMKDRGWRFAPKGRGTASSPDLRPLETPVSPLRNRVAPEGSR